jgi:hypothetical protein
MTGDVLFEFRRIGRSVRVAAVDARTGREAIVVGPIEAGDAALARLARQKLERLLAREAEPSRGR